MSDVKISQLSAAQPLSGAEYVPIVQKSANNRNTLTSFRTTIGAVGNYLKKSVIPVGTIWPYAASVDGVVHKIPTGWLMCDGGSVLISVYRDLYNAIGNTYGDNAARATNFTLPNLRAKIPLGHCTTATAYSPTFGNFQGQAIILGQQGGEFNHTLTVSELPTHTHAITLNSSATITPNLPFLANPGAGGGVEQGQEGQPDGAYSSKHKVSIDNVKVVASASATGGGQSHTNTPPYFVINYIIKY